MKAYSSALPFSSSSSRVNWALSCLRASLTFIAYRAAMCDRPGHPDRDHCHPCRPCPIRQGCRRPRPAGAGPVETLSAHRVAPADARNSASCSPKSIAAPGRHRYTVGYYHSHLNTISEHPANLDAVLDSSDPKYVHLLPRHCAFPGRRRRPREGHPEISEPHPTPAPEGRGGYVRGSRPANTHSRGWN